MTDLRKAAEMALEALDLAQSLTEESQHHGKILSSYKALRAALEQGKPHEPWCASLTQLLMSNPPQPAKCNCREDKP
jgi:hypothetical protein